MTGQTAAHNIARGAAISTVHTLLLIAPPAAVGVDLGRLMDLPGLGFLILANLFCLAEHDSRGGWIECRREPSRHADHLLAGSTGLALLFSFWVSLGTHPAHTSDSAVASTHLAITGAALVAIGIASRWSAMRALGPSFVSAPEVWPTRSLVRRGPYRLSRHPSETGLLLVGFGAAALLGSPLGAAATAFVLLPLTVLRVRREERVLRREYGGAYLEYARNVKGWIPGLL